MLCGPVNRTCQQIALLEQKNRMLLLLLLLMMMMVMMMTASIFYLLRLPVGKLPQNSGKNFYGAP